MCIQLNRKTIGICVAVLAAILALAVGIGISVKNKTKADTQVAATTSTQEETEAAQDNQLADWRDGRSIETIYMVKNDKTTEENATEAYDIIIDRLNNLFREEYEIEQEEEYYVLRIATDALEGVNINNFLRYHVFRPDELYVVHNQKEYYKADRSNITTAEVKEGIPEGFTPKDEEKVYDTYKVEFDQIIEVADQYEEGCNLCWGLLVDRSGEVICEKIKQSIESVIGVEPETTYSNGECRIKFKQDVSDKYASNIFRICDALLDAPIFEYNGINTLPSDANMFVNFYDSEDRIQSRVIINRDARTSFNEHDKEITIVFWSANVAPNKLEMLEEQIFELQDDFKKDPKYADFYVSVTKSMQ